jgi:glutaminase
LKKNAGFQLKKHKIAQKELSKLEGDGGEGLSWRQFLRAMRKPTLLTRAFKDELAVPRWVTFQQTLKEIFNNVKKTVPATVGKKTDVIPELQLVDREEFGCAVCTVDGQMFTIGTEEDFSLQACVFPVLYAQIVEKLGYEEFHRHIGKEPSGAYHNAIALNSEGKPHNALVNTGAVAMCRMFEPNKVASERFKDILTYASDLAGTKLGFSQTVYLSEKAAAYQPFAMAHYMASKGALSNKRTDIEAAMDLYFQLNSIEANCEKLSVIAATFANGGVNPLTSKQMLQESTVKQTTALLHSCGMYIASGEWACNVGLPAKSGVSGALWLIVPGVCGIAIYAPPIDENATSVRGAALARAIADRFSWNLFDVLHSATS